MFYFYFCSVQQSVVTQNSSLILSLNMKWLLHAGNHWSHVCSQNTCTGIIQNTKLQQRWGRWFSRPLPHWLASGSWWLLMEGPTATYMCATLAGLSGLSDREPHQLRRKCIIEGGWKKRSKDQYDLISLYNFMKFSRKSKIFIVCQIVFLYLLDLKF